MGDWDAGAVTGGWAAPSNPHFSEKENTGGDTWNYDSNEPAGNAGDFNGNNYNGDNYNGDDYNGNANEAGAYANEKCFGCGEEG
jgi:hypothetical protein